MIYPFEDRYRTETNPIFEESNKYVKWMEVEAALAEVHEELGHIPKGSAAKIRAAIPKVKPERIKEIESEIHHDLMAMVKALTEQSGDAGKYVHLGSTSYDIEDTATAMIFRDAMGLTEKKLRSFASVLKKLALEHKDHVCIGRTHGQHATPTTYGLKFAIYYREVLRHLDRLEESKKRILVGKMSGATGTMATFDDEGIRIQKMVMKKLGLKPAEASNQVIQRDRHAEIIFILALVAATLEKIAKEIRNLQRSEILEVSEPFGAKQVGSSTMPQKRNPHKSERVCSIARLVRSNVAVALENISLEHERDLTNSASERVIFSESFMAVTYMLDEMNKILSGLQFFDDNIDKNLELTNGLVMAERLMILLVERGMGRQDAHELARTLAQKAFKEKKHLKEVVKQEKKITELIPAKELDALFNPKTYIGKAQEIVKDAVSE